MIGICIKFFHANYGGMLQAYATIKMLEERGLDYELIQYEKKHTPVGFVKSIPRLLNGVLLNDKYEALEKELEKKRHPEFRRNDAIRMEAFYAFQKANFTKLSPVFVGYEALCAGSKRYSVVISGSDQLWSPAGLPTNYYNLMFVPDEVRKISYASSFGVSKIPWYQRKRTATFLERIPYISMRENRGSEIVKELIGRDVPVILDPVFQFDQAGWEKLIPVQRELEEPYIFAYFLGANPVYRKEVIKLAGRTGLKVVALRHLDQYVDIDEKFGDFAPYDVNPARFLNLLRGAEYVCTDSFHGMCFSIINKKKFMVFNRYGARSRASKNSRIESLCDNLALQERRFTGDNIFEIEKPVEDQLVQNRLQYLKRLTNKYLDQALNDIF